MILTEYLATPFKSEKLPLVIKATIKTLRQGKHAFDGIAFRGLSGALVAPILGFALKKKLLAVRKPEQRHSSLRLEGDVSIRRYIIVDDFVSGGGTVRAIHDSVKEAIPDAVCVGLVMYNQAQYHFDADSPYNRCTDMKNIAPTLEFMYGIGGYEL